MVVRELFSCEGMSDESRYMGLDVEEDVGHEEELAQANSSGHVDEDWNAPDCPPTPTPDNDIGYSSSSEASFRVANVQEFPPECVVFF